MKIALASDLHLEFQDINLTNDEGAELLILSGDIMIAEDLHNHKHFDYNPYTSGALADLGRRQLTALRFRDFLKSRMLSTLRVIMNSITVSGKQVWITCVKNAPNLLMSTS
jgi:predicted phosphodiesterase